MKKINLLFSAIALAGIVSCQDIAYDITTPQASTSFVATVPGYIPESKTTMGPYDEVNHKQPILWAAGDKIDIYGITGTSVKKAVFAITDGIGEKSATFTYESGDDVVGSDAIYAVYPSGIAGSTCSADGELSVSTALNLGNQTAVEGGFDPELAIMSATLEGGMLAFRHEAYYFRIQIPDDGITKVEIESQRKVFATKPVFYLTDGSVSNDNAQSTSIAATGSFIKGSDYYLCGIPRKTTNTDKIGTLTVRYTRGGVVKTLTTNAASISNVRPSAGTVYDLGCPPIRPSINASDVDILKTDTSGSIVFTIDDPAAGGVVTAGLTDGKVTTISNFALGAVGDGNVAFTCSANDGGTKYAYVTLTYTYDVSRKVTKDIVITQEADVIVPHTYVFYVDSEGKMVQTEDGVASSYFTNTGTTVLKCASSGYFGVDSYSILGDTYNYAKKLDSSNKLSFTTHSGVNSTIRFFAASRNSGTNARMQLVTGSTVVVDANPMSWSDGKAVLYDSGTVALDAETEYAFSKKSNEQGLFYVVVTESLP